MLIESMSANAEPNKPNFTIKNHVAGIRMANKIIPLTKSNLQKVEVPIIILFKPVEASIVLAIQIKNIVDKPNFHVSGICNTSINGTTFNQIFPNKNKAIKDRLIHDLL